MPTTYWDYIRVEDLLKLQGGLEDDEPDLSNHEVLFITVHQVFELWFKLVLRELATLRDVFRQDVVPESSLAAAGRSLDRIRRVLGVANQHWSIMESLSTKDYLDFRDKLSPASGFQSVQMREIEILLGLEDEDRVGLGEGGRWREALRNPDGSPAAALGRAEARVADHPTLKEAVDAWLYRTPIRGSTPSRPGDSVVVGAFVQDYLSSLQGRQAAESAAAEAWLSPNDLRRRRIRAAILFIESYRALPLLSWPRELLDRIVEVEQTLLIFRQRHARMVERIIGRRVGTGGTSGVQYLDETALAYRVFGDLWEARTFLLPEAALPPLRESAYYDFPSS